MDLFLAETLQKPLLEDSAKMRLCFHTLQYISIGQKSLVTPPVYLDSYM
jgi:hypothetical protein